MPSSGVQTCALDRKSTRLNSSHTLISYAVFCLKKKHLHLGLTRAVQCPGLPALDHHRHLRLSVGLAGDVQGLALFALGAHRQLFFFFFNDRATTEIYTLSLHAALPI